jgi:hypothetical protein
MPLVLKDRVKVTSTTAGTGTFTLGAASTGFQSFSVIGDGNTTFYTIALQGGNEWEVGLGTYTASGTTLARTTVIESSNGGTLVNFSAGTKDVFVTQPAERTVYDSTGSTGGTDAVSTNTANTVVRRDGSGNFSAGTITAALSGNATNVTGIVAATNGGTGQSTYAVGDLLVGGATNTLAKLADVATGNALISGGVGVAPSYGKIGLTTHVSGTLPLANGGTNSTTAPQAHATLMGWTTTATAAGTTTLTNTSTYQQEFTGTTTQTVVMPVTSTLALGWAYEIINNSTGNLTIQSSGLNTIATLTAGTTASVVCTAITGTTAASWDFDFDGFSSETGTGSVVRATSPTLVTPALGTPASGVVTNLTGTASININGTVGATTANTGAFTTLSASGTINFNTTGSNISIGTGQSGTPTLSFGGTGQTGAITLGQSTVSQTTNIQAGATASGSTKTMNIGTGGLTGSTTSIAIGSTAGTSTTTVNGVFTTPVPQASNGLVVNSNTVSASYSIPSGSSASSVGPITVASGQTVTVPSGSRWVVL